MHLPLSKHTATLCAPVLRGLSGACSDRPSRSFFKPGDPPTAAAAGLDQTLRGFPLVDGRHCSRAPGTRCVWVLMLLRAFDVQVVRQSFQQSPSASCCPAQVEQLVMRTFEQIVGHLNP